MLAEPAHLQKRGKGQPSTVAAGDSPYPQGDLSKPATACRQSGRKAYGAISIVTALLARNDQQLSTLPSTAFGSTQFEMPLLLPCSMHARCLHEAMVI
jgi:hypothetical protein